MEESTTQTAPETPTGSESLGESGQAAHKTYGGLGATLPSWETGFYNISNWDKNTIKMQKNRGFIDRYHKN